ncbi:hypothetical protein [Alkalilacustris brevis]|uniref:hypothetical protein n=1 Tax=Alkalilacustris brevis TaxID=2026338 RepID=UPI000E0E052E|nr:hypothetical protein [Alkalilacustris brevis]
MSSFDRRKLLIALPGLLVLGAAGCGMRPAYGPGGTGGALRGRVRADDPQTREQQQFVARLEERLGPPQQAEFRLSYEITTGSDVRLGSGALRDSRSQIFGRARYTLRRMGEDDAEIERGEVTQFVGYSSTSTPLANRAAREDARARLMVLLADGVVTRLLAGAPG